MPRVAIALVALVVAGLGVLSPAAATPARAAEVNPKVVIIVGATGSVTSMYRSYGDELYNEAIKYTTNVVKVYSPNATWAAVKAAVNGASIVVYLGHGNGWPSPYGNDAYYTTKDGFGLNYDVNGDGKLTDSELKYYGEPSIKTLTPAPNAVVLLFHLCYASGNSEPGMAEPTLSVARQRADNYAAAFQAAGAKAVIAIGHSHDPYYISALFSSRQSIKDYWTKAPHFNNHVLTYASERTPGATELLDPDYATPSGFWRSLTGDMTLQTADVTGAAYAPTSGDPATIAVPGNATPVTAGTPLYPTLADAAAATNPGATVPATTTVRVDALEATTTTIGAAPIYRVHTDDGAKGWMTGPGLVPRDSLAPRLWTVGDGTGAFSPNADGVSDTMLLSLRLSESAAWTLTITSAEGKLLRKTTGTGAIASVNWGPASGALPDGTYPWQLTATDSWGNGPLEADGELVIDTVAPALTVAGDATAVTTFSPNADGVLDTAAFSVTTTEAGEVRLSVRNAAGVVVTSYPAALAGLVGSAAWDGTTATGARAPDGAYTVSLAARDLAGNESKAVSRKVVVDRTLGFATANRVVFFPQDGDTLAPKVAFGFRLASAATVDWAIANSAGVVVRTLKTAAPLTAGVYSFTWDGRDDKGAYVARGTYSSQVTAVDPLGTSTLRASTVADAFKVSISDSTPARGQSISVTSITAETLSIAPRVAIYQPGLSVWSVGTVRVDTGVYRASFKLKSSGTGTLKLKVYAKDSLGGFQYSYKSVPLH